MKILFYATNGIGLGHVFRTLNIAKAIRQIIDCEILFLTNTHFTQIFEKEGFNYVTGGINSKEQIVNNISRNEYMKINSLFVLEEIKKFKPEIILFDGDILPDVLEYSQANNIFSTYILRETENKDYFIEFKNKLSIFNLILIPHKKEEITSGFNEVLNLGFDKRKIFFVGNIFREHNIEKLSNVIMKYQKEKDELLVTVVNGAGGIETETKEFFNQIANFAKKINSENKRIKWVFVKGPLYSKELHFNDSKFKIIDYELDLPELFTISDLIISRGGYNSINEIIAAKTPALLSPVSRFLDSQDYRITKYVDKGFMKKLEISNTEKSLELIKNTLNKKNLDKMKLNYSSYSHGNGSLNAALRVIKEFYNYNKKANIAFLKYNINTIGENFIYEETEKIERYNSFYFCGRIMNRDRQLQTVCYEPFKELFSPKWPKFSKKYLSVYNNGIDLFYDFIKSRNIKLLHAQFATDALFYYELIKKSKMPLIVNIRGYDLYSDKICIEIPSLFEITNKFIVKSKSMKEELIKLGCDQSKIKVIYGGVDVDNISFNPRKLKNNLKILSVGRFVEKKGFDITLGSFKEILNEYPYAKLTLIGEGELKQNIEKIIETLGLEKNVEIKSFMPHEEFIKELDNHDIFILASKTASNGDKEGIPNVLKEAMASGMPVISTMHSGIPELIQDGINGYLVKEGDYHSIVSKINEYVINEKKTFEMCLNARLNVEKNFNVNNTVSQTELIYDELAMPNLVKNAILVQQGQKPIEFRTDLHLVAGCNSKCIMCDDWKNKVVSDFSTEKIIALFDELKKFGVTYVRFHGQEPTIRKDFTLLIKEAKARGFRVGVKTNALLLNEKMIKDVSDSLDDLYLSIDSAFENVHNSIRGRSDSFNKNLNAAKLIKQINPKINLYLNSVVCVANYNDLDKMMDLGKKLNADRVSFVNLNTKNKRDISQVKLTKEHLKEFYFKVLPKILEKSIEYGIRFNLDPQFYKLLGMPREKQLIELKENPEQFEEEINNFEENDYGKTFYEKATCYGILDHNTIDWKGNVFPCCAMPRAPELAIGNVFENNFSEIWKSEKYTNYREDIIHGKCKFKNQCTRGQAQTKETNKWLYKKPLSLNLTTESLTNQYEHDDDLAKQKLKNMIYFAFLKTEFYNKKFKNVSKLNEHDFDISQLSITTRDELRLEVPKIINNYFELEYDFFKTSSRGEEAFVFARPLKYSDFPKMAVSFMNNGKWEMGNPWLKLTSINCLNSGCFSREDTEKTTILIKTSDNFLQEQKENIISRYITMKDSKTRIIHANPSYLKILLFMFKKYNLRLEKRYVVNSTYELLLPTTKKKIEQFLDCEIFNQYGCSEVGPISFNCKLNKNHIFTESVYVEVIPDKLSFGREDIGRVVVTDLRNKVMPFVRYYTGDLAKVSDNKNCSCGFTTPIMGNVVGREKDLIFYNGKAITPLEIDSIFYDTENILIYQLQTLRKFDQNERLQTLRKFDQNERLQTLGKTNSEKRKFIINLVLEDPSKAFLSEQIISRFRKVFDDVDIKIKLVDYILPDESGKYKSIIAQPLLKREIISEMNFFRKELETKTSFANKLDKKLIKKSCKLAVLN